MRDTIAHAVWGDMADEQISNFELLEKAAQIVSAYVSNNPINSSDLPDLVHAVHDQLGQLANEATEPARPAPAVPIKKSVTDTHIICLTGIANDRLSWGD